MARKKRVLICASTVPFTSGGAERHVEGLARAVAGAGYEVDVMEIPYAWDPPERMISSCMQWRMVDLAQPAYGRIDLVVATKFPTYAIESENKVAWVFHQHRGIYDLEGTMYYDVPEDPYQLECCEVVRKMDRSFLSECRTVFANSETVAERLSRYSGVDSEPLYHPPPLDGKHYSKGYGDDILLVGRLEPLKRVDLAIRAMKHVEKKGAHLRIVGTGFLEEPLREIAREEGVTDRVVFDGFVPDKELLEMYARAGCVAFVPFGEDLGYVTLEAMQSSRPVIVTEDSGGPLEFVKDCVTGRVIEARPEPLAEAIDQLLSDRGLARQLGRAGREAVRGISWENVVDRLIRPHLE